jgi:hypothetical protein
LEKKLVLTKTQYNLVREIALREIQNRTKPYNEEDDIFRSKCWVEGLLGTLAKEGLTLSYTKGDEHGIIASPFEPKP